MLRVIDDEDYDYSSAEDNQSTPTVDSDYVHVVPTPEQIYFNRLCGLQSELKQRRLDLERFTSYLVEAERESKKWHDNIARKEAEILEFESWISDLQKETNYVN